MGKKFTRQWVLFLAFVSLNARSILFLFFLDVSANWRFSICIYLGQSSYVFLFYHFARFLFYLICLQGRGAHTIENIPHAKDLWLSLPVRMDGSLFHCSRSWCIDWIESQSWNQQIQVVIWLLKHIQPELERLVQSPYEDARELISVSFIRGFVIFLIESLI